MRTANGDLIVVLPGVLGSTLRRNGRRTWGVGSLARNLPTLSRSLTENLSLPDEAFTDRDAGYDDGTVPDGLLRSQGTVPPRGLGVAIPGFWSLVDGYDLLVDKLHQTFDQRDVLEFPYDWRQSNRVSARKLRQAVEPLMRYRRAYHPNAHLILIGHSMGGLVARYYAEVLDVERFTSRVITIGTPYKGAAKALGVLANDHVELAAGIRFRLGDLARSLPSVAELLPTYPCLGDSADNLVTIGDDMAIPGLPERHRKHALEFQAEIDEHVAANGENRPAYTAILSYRQPTDTWASVCRGEVNLHRPDEWQLRGDGTVPRQSALPPEWPTHASGNFVPGKHAALQQSAGAWEQIRGVLTGSAYRRPMADRHEIIVEASDLVAVGEVWRVQAQAADPEGIPRGPGALSLVVQVVSDQKVVASAPMRWEGDAYRASLCISTAGMHRWSVEADPHSTSGVVPVADAVLCAQP